MTTGSGPVTPGGRISAQPVSTPPRAADTNVPSSTGPGSTSGTTPAVAVESEPVLDGRTARQHALLDADTDHARRSRPRRRRRGRSGGSARSQVCLWTTSAADGHPGVGLEHDPAPAPARRAPRARRGAWARPPWSASCVPPTSRRRWCAGPAPTARSHRLRRCGPRRCWPTWDAARAEAWADGDVRRLGELYTPDSVAGRRDRAMLRAWLARGLVVRGLTTQVLALVRGAPGRRHLGPPGHRPGRRRHRRRPHHPPAAAARHAPPPRPSRFAGSRASGWSSQSRAR